MPRKRILSLSGTLASLASCKTLALKLNQLISLGVIFFINECNAYYQIYIGMRRVNVKFWIERWSKRSYLLYNSGSRKALHNRINNNPAATCYYFFCANNLFKRIVAAFYQNIRLHNINKFQGCVFIKDHNRI